MTKNWEVREYDRVDGLIRFWTIENRTEIEASKEAEAQIGYDAADWTMTEIKEEI
jgi:hypothetical protein